MKTRYFTFYLVMVTALVLTLNNANIGYALSKNAYITNFNDSTVSVIDIDTDIVINTIPVGTGPFGVAVSDIRNRVYVTNYYNTISVIDTIAQTVIDTIPIDNTPTGIAINPNGTLVYAAFNRINGASLAVIDTSSNTIIKKIDVGEYPWGVDVNSSGTRAYVINRYDTDNIYIGGPIPGVIKVIDTTNNSVIASIPVGNDPLGIVVNKAGTRVYVVGDGNVLYTIDTTTNSVINSVYVGFRPWGIAINSTGSLVYVANRLIFGGSVAVIDTSSNSVVESIEVGENPVGISLSPNDLKAYIACGGSKKVYVLDTVTNSIITTIAVGRGPVAFGKFIDTSSYIKVNIDIKPGDDTNSINPKSKGKIPVAILSTENFDAPSQIDLTNLTFGQTGDEQSLAFCQGAEDVNRDGLQDLVCHFYTQETGFQCGDTVGILMGKTKGGMVIGGSDLVKIVPCK